MGGGMRNMAARHSQRWLDWRLLLARIVLVGLLVAPSIQDLTQKYCADVNTGQSNFIETNTFMSNGACSDKCKSKHAFAIVQDQNCWCTDFAPNETNRKSVSNCNENCPGYPFEKCGNVKSGLFGYIALDKSPSGTSEPMEPSATTPITSVNVVTISGTIVTQTVTSMPSSGSKMTKGSKSSNKTVIAVIVAVVVAVAVIVGAIFIFFCFLRRRKRESEFVVEPATPFPRRNTSTLSKSGLLTQVPSSGATTDQYESASPMSEQRASRLIVYDQRLNPNALMQHNDGSKTSVLTMQDNCDYTRTLNVRNPDPPED